MKIYSVESAEKAAERELTALCLENEYHCDLLQTDLNQYSEIMEQLVSEGTKIQLLKDKIEENKQAIERRFGRNDALV